MDAQPWYSPLARMLVDRPLLLPHRENTLYLPFDPDKRHPLASKLRLMACRLKWLSLENRGVSKSAQELILNSWRDSTQKKYRPYWRKWQKFACEQSIDPFCPSVNKVLDFLSGLYNQGLGYSGINTARCALSSLVTLENMGNMTIGKHPLVQRLVKGVFHETPSLPRYHNTWDTNKVLQFLKTFASLTEIKLRELTYKLIMLCALVTGQRCQSLHLMNLDTMIKSASSYRFVIHNLVKQSAPGKAQPVLVLPKFDEDERLCVYSVLEEYVQRTNSIRNNESQLFISFAKPHKKVSKDTIARWIKHVMSLSGIDTSVFKPHSTRAASTSKASKCSVPISHIMSAASWPSDSTFHKFYKREVGQLQDSADTFGQAILLDATN